jgi:CO/xanthine dehydrogenase Mo-binding subunit
LLGHGPFVAVPTHCPGVAAAIANAVYHATERRVRDLPITPDILAA